MQASCCPGWFVPRLMLAIVAAVLWGCDAGPLAEPQETAATDNREVASDAKQSAGAAEATGASSAERSPAGGNSNGTPTAGGNSRGAATPQAAYAAYTAAGRAGDHVRSFDLLAPESQQLRFSLALKRARLKRLNVGPVFQKYGFNGRLADVQDKSACYAELRRLVDSRSSTSARNMSANSTLANVQIHGDQATAKIRGTFNGRAVNGAIGFQRIDGSWFVQLSAARGVSVATSRGPELPENEPPAGDAPALPSGHSESRAVPTVRREIKHELTDSRPTVGPGPDAHVISHRFGDDIVRPLSSSPFVLVEHTLWNLETGESVADTTAITSAARSVALSPDGKLIAVRDRRDETPLNVYEVGSNRRVCQIQAWKAPARFETFGFVAPDRLMVVWTNWDGNRALMVTQVWDATTGEGIAAVGTPTFRERALSPDGQWLAMYDPKITSGSDRFAVVDLIREKPEPEELIFPPAILRQATIIDLEGVAVDQTAGHWAAVGTVHTMEAAGLALWDLKTRRHDKNLLVPIIANDFAETDRGGTPLLQAGPRAATWWVAGRYLVDAATGRPLWQVAVPHRHEHNGGWVVPGGRVAVPASHPPHACRLVSLPVPEEELQRALSAMENASVAAHVRPGQPVSLSVHAAPEQAASAPKWSAALQQVVAGRLAASGITIAPNQNVVLHAEYLESNSHRLSDSGKSRVFFDASVKLSWRIAGEDAPIWNVETVRTIDRDDQQSDLGFVLDIRRLLAHTTIPYFMPEDPTTPTLPLLTVANPSVE